jgi:hypothetical protein
MSTDPSTSSTAAWTFSGFSFPNTTPIPDQVFDELLPRLSGAELKVLLYICRRTFGFKKASDDISINQMLNGIVKRDGTRIDYGTGLSKPSLIKALKDLQEKGILIAVRQSSEEKGNEPTNYRLRFVEAEVGTGEEEEPQTAGQAQTEKNFTPLGQKTLLGGRTKNFTKPLVKKLYPQETELQAYKPVNVNGDEFKQEPNQTSRQPQNSISKLPDLDQPADRMQYVADFILQQLKDAHSLGFYRLIAAKVPEAVIRQALAEIKVDGAKNPAKLFTYKMKTYALEQLKHTNEDEAAVQPSAPNQAQSQVTEPLLVDAHLQVEERSPKQAQEIGQLEQVAGEWGSMDREQHLWQQVLADLKVQLTSVIGYNLLENSLLLSVANGKAVIALPNQWAKEYVSQRLAPSICQALAQHLEGQTVHVNFITPDQTPGSTLATGVSLGVAPDSHPDGHPLVEG